ncbi:MAG: hypothetical protein ABI351_08235 [Herbaspirillum sp.]
MNRLLAAPVLLGMLLLLLAGAAGFGWIWLRSGRPEQLNLLQIEVMLIPLALLLVAVLNWGTDREKLAITVWATVMFGMLLALVYALYVGANSTVAATNVEVESLQRYGVELSPQQQAHIFNGAFSDQIQHDVGRVETMRSAVFRDQSMLILFHFRFPEHATDYVNLLMRSFNGTKRVLESGGGLTLEKSQQLQHLRQYGRDVLSLTAVDAASLQTRLRDWQLPPPGQTAELGQIDNSGSFGPGFDQWPFALAYGVSCVLLLVGFLLWLGPWAATLPPSPLVSATAPQTLRARLLALREIAPAVQVEPGSGPDDLTVTYAYSNGKRKVRMRLRLDSERQQVLAKEYIGVGGDAPINGSEAQMRFLRHVGELHPDADIVFSADWAVTIPTEARRKPLGVRVLNDSVQLPPEIVAHFMEDRPAGATDLPLLLAEIAYQSGWQWRAVFFF